MNFSVFAAELANHFYYQTLLNWFMLRQRYVSFDQFLQQSKFIKMGNI